MVILGHLGKTRLLSSVCSLKYKSQLKKQNISLITFCCISYHIILQGENFILIQLPYQVHDQDMLLSI